MKTAVKYLSCLLIIILFATGGAQAQSSDPRSLYSQSDVIVVGTASTFSPVGDDLRFQIDVEMPIKGNVSAHTLLDARSPNPQIPGSTLGDLKTTVRGIWFLKLDADQIYHCLPGGRSLPQGLVLSVPPQPASEPPLKLQSSDSSQETLVKLAAAALVQGIGRPDQFFLAAGGARTPVVLEIVKYLSTSANPITRAVGIASLILRNDETIILDVVETRKSLSGKQIDLIAPMLANNYRGQNPEVIRALGTVIADPSSPPALRDAAGQVLRAVHNKDALPYLAMLLDSSDPKEQAYGSLGFSAFVHGWGIIPLESGIDMSWMINATPTAYLTPELKQQLSNKKPGETAALWKNWWRDHQAELMHQ